MPAIPVETVVELLMAGVSLDVDYEEFDHQRVIGVYVPVGNGAVAAATEDELRTKLRDYLLTLVPQPKLLSECEEGVPCVRVNRNGEWCVVVREGSSAYSMHDKPMFRELVDRDANRVKVIQPVEVQK